MTKVDATHFMMLFPTGNYQPFSYDRDLAVVRLIIMLQQDMTQLMAFGTLLTKLLFKETVFPQGKRGAVIQAVGGVKYCSSCAHILFSSQSKARHIPGGRINNECV